MRHTRLVAGLVIGRTDWVYPASKAASSRVPATATGSVIEVDEAVVDP